MFKRLYLLIVLAIIAMPCGAWGANTSYYVDATSGNDINSGLSNAQAWKTISKVNSFPSFASGDNVYFKCGETWTFSANEKLTVDWSGTSGDPVVIGAYYMAGSTEVHGVSGNRPVFDGNYIAPSTPPTSSYFGLIQVKSVSYVTVMDIEIQETGFYGVGFDTGSNFEANNIFVDGAYSAGIRFKSVTTGKAYDNEITDAARSELTAGWPAVLVSVSSSYIEMKRNIVHESYGEGIGIYTSSHDCTVQDNIVYASKHVGIYIDHSWNNLIYRNIVYGTTDSTFHDLAWGPNWGIASSDESWTTPKSQNNKIIGNLVAYCYWGISAQTGTSTWSMQNLEISNNTIIDCVYNIRIGTFAGYSNSNIRNNISYCLSGDCVHASVPSSHSGLTINYNLWSSTPPTSVQGANDPSYAAPGLNKTSGWRTMTGGDALGSWWALSSGASPAVDVGTPTGYQVIVPTSTWTSSVSSVDNTTGSGPEIGAFAWMTDDSDGDGISDDCETDAGTNPALSTDNDTEAEKVATIVAGADASPDGNCTITDMENTGLTGLITDNLGAYETAIQSGSPADLAAMQTIIDTTNGTQVNDTSGDGDCLAHYPLDTNANDDKGGTALTFNNSAAISGGWLDLENYPSDQNQGAILAAENLPASTWWLSGQSGIGGACALFQPETLPASAKYVIIGPLEWNNTKNVWDISLRTDGTLDIEIGYNSGASSEHVYTTTPLTAGNTYGVCMFYNATADDLWVYVRNSDGTTVGVDIYDSDLLPEGATFNQEDSDFTIGYSGDNWGSFDGKIKEVAIWNDIDGSTFISQYASQWVQGTYARTTTGDCTATYVPTLTEDANDPVGAYNGREFAGFKYTPTANECLCAVDAYNTSHSGTLSANYHVRVFALDGSNQPTSSLGTSSAAAGGSMSDNTWLSTNGGLPTFSPCISLTSGTAYGIAIFPDTDSTLDDDPEISGTNYWNIAIDNENNHAGDAAKLGGMFKWAWAADFPYSITTSDLEDDPLIKIHTQIVGDTPPTVTTLGAPGLITTPDGECTYAANTTASWTDTTVRYFGVPISAALTVTGLQGWPTIPLLAGPASTDVTYANYYGQCTDSGSQRYMVFQYSPNSGDRTTDLLAESAVMNCTKDGVQVANAVDSNDFDLCSGEYNAITSADVSGTGTIDISIPFPSVLALTAGTFTDIDTETDESYEYTGQFSTLTAAIAAFSLIADDNITIGTITEPGAVDLSAMDGTSGHEIVFDGGSAGSQTTWTAASGITFGDYTFISDIYIAGPVIIGEGSKIERCKLQ